MEVAKMAEYISKQAFKEKYLCCGYLPEMSEVEFDAFPAADVVEVRHGRWIDLRATYKDGSGHLIATYCSECGTDMDIGKANYCPNCGARMGKEDDLG